MFTGYRFRGTILLFSRRDLTEITTTTQHDWMAGRTGLVIYNRYLYSYFHELIQDSEKCSMCS